MQEYVERVLLVVQHMFTVTIGEAKYIASLDLTAGRVPHELPGEDVFHRTGSDLFGLRSE